MSNAKWNTDKDSGDFNIGYTKASDGSSTWTVDNIQVVLLADIRRELRKLNALLGCHNFIRIPSVLDRIDKNTIKRPRKVKVTK